MSRQACLCLQLSARITLLFSMHVSLACKFGQHLAASIAMLIDSYYNKDRHRPVNKLCMALSSYTTQIQIHRSSSALQFRLPLFIISPLHDFNYHQVLEIQCSCDIKLHFTLQAMAMLIIGSWIVHITPISCSTFVLI